MRRKLAAALLSACSSRSSGSKGSSAIGGGLASSAGRGIRTLALSTTTAANSPSTPFARGGTASCSSSNGSSSSASSSSWSRSSFFCSRGFHTSSASFSSSSSSSKPRDYYDILGVPRGAPEAEVKRAFYRLAKKHHPDAHASASESEKEEAAREFREVNKAYDTLRDPQKRALYDQVGVDAYEGGVGAGGGAGAGGFGGGGFGGGGFGGFGGGGAQGQQQHPDVEDIFAAFFGGLGGQRGGAGARTAGGFSWTSSSGPNPFAAAAMMRSPDIHVSLRLPFDAAARGGRRTLNLAGIGGGGSGGDSRQVEIDIPPGIDTGAVLRLSGRGAPLPPNAPKGAARGNLLVEVEVEPSPIFTRRSSFLGGRPEDVEVDAEVEIWDAALGGNIKVPTPLDGDRELSLRPGTQPGDRFRMKGYGLPKLSHNRRAPQQRGDQFVKVGVKIPRNLSPRAAALLRELGDEVSKKGGSNSSSSHSSSSSSDKAKAA